MILPASTIEALTKERNRLRQTNDEFQREYPTRAAPTAEPRWRPTPLRRDASRYRGTSSAVLAVAQPRTSALLPRAGCALPQPWRRP